jgi:hypothetical protein
MADEDPAPEPDVAAPSTTPPTPPAVHATDETESQPDEAAVAKEAASRTDNYFTTIGQLATDTLIVGGERIRRPRRSLEVSEDEIERTLRFFHDPPAFGEALSRLVDNLAVLCGAEGSGRWCAALRLLHGPHCPGADRTRPIERLAPETRLATLRDHHFVPGGRYLLGDLISDDHVAQLRFDTDALAGRLRDVGAFLVITSGAAPTDFGQHAVAWTPVEVIAVFDAYARTVGMSPEDAAAARGLVAPLPLHRFAEFVDVLKRDGLEGARANFGGELVADLRTLLDNEDKPIVPDLVPLVTAALIPDAVEAEHERRAATLCTEIDDHAERKRSDADYVDTLRPSRSGRRQFVCRQQGALSSVTVVGLAAGLPAAAVLAELHERYGDELWVPLRTWLEAQPDGNLRITRSLARGMAALRQVDTKLTEQVLDTWAAGDDHHRWAAACANAALCVDDRGVRIALTQAILWASGIPRKRITAAYAFSLGLSVSEPRQAISRLWHLTLRDAVVAIYARAHLVALTWDIARAGTRPHVLAVAEDQLSYLVNARPDDDPLIGRALTNVERILTVRTVKDTPLTAQVLAADPGQAERLGLLWAHLLRSWRHRASALDELHAAYTRLDDPTPAALGTAIHRQMSPMQWQWLCRDLGFELRTEVPEVLEPAT